MYQSQPAFVDGVVDADFDVVIADATVVAAVVIDAVGVTDDADFLIHFIVLSHHNTSYSLICFPVLGYCYCCQCINQ